jgi:hypothetical protein
MCKQSGREMASTPEVEDLPPNRQKIAAAQQPRACLSSRSLSKQDRQLGHPPRPAERLTTTCRNQIGERRPLPSRSRGEASRLLEGYEAISQPPIPGSDHRSAKNGSSTTSDRPAQLGCTDGHGLHGIEPDTTRETTRRLKLLSIQKARPPLS